VILVISLNPTLDVTHHVPGVDWAGVNRPAVIRVRAGGKGLNVARTLRVIGVEIQVIGLAGGVRASRWFPHWGAGVPASLTRIGGETRWTFAVVGAFGLPARSPRHRPPPPSSSRRPWGRHAQGGGHDQAGSRGNVTSLRLILVTSPWDNRESPGSARSTCHAR
jgi:hypothetical protein